MSSFVACLWLLCLLANAWGQQVSKNAAHTASSRRVSVSTSRLPFFFEPNRGQAPTEDAYVAHVGGMRIGFSPGSARFVLPSATQYGDLRFVLRGASQDASLTPSRKTGGESNYLLGNQASAWKTHIPEYEQLTYHHIYPGIDLTFYGNAGRLEHDFIVQPGADYRQIHMQYQGAQKLTLSQNGDLLVTVADTELIVRAPLIYQNSLGQRQTRHGRFRLLPDNQVAFQVDHADPSQTLIIDPVLDYATYLADLSISVASSAVDSAGNTYIVGQTSSSKYPVTPGDTQGSCVSCANKPDIFITKLNTTGTAQIYSTFLGGSDYDQPEQIAVDANGNAVVAGQTASADFPLKNPISSGVSSSQDGFVTSIAPDGASLNFSSRFGGVSSPSQGLPTIAWSVATDSAGNVYTSGTTESPYIPVTSGALNAGKPSYGSDYVFLTKLQPTGGIVYSAMLGATGSASECCSTVGLAIDSGGDAYLAGTVGGSNYGNSTAVSWPVTPGAYQSTLRTAGSAAPFVAKISPDGSTFLYSTLVETGIASAMALTPDQQVILAGSFGGILGQTFTTTPDAISSTPSNGLLTRISADGTRLVYASYFGLPAFPDSGPYITALALDANDNVWIGGNAGHSYDAVPLLHPLQSLPGNGPSLNIGSAFVSELDPQIHQLLFSTYFNGIQNSSFINSLAIDAQGRAHIAGTALNDLPTTPSAYLGSVTPPPPGYIYQYGFAAVIDSSTPGPGICFANPSPIIAYVGASQQSSITISNCGNAPLTINSVQLSGTYFTSQPVTPCVTTLQPSATCKLAITFSPGLVGAVNASLNVASNAPVPVSVLPLSGNGIAPSNGLAISLSSTSVNFGSLAIGTSSSQQNIIVKSVNNSPLTISSVTATGDFSEQNTCTTANLANGSCTIFLTFTPTTSGTRIGTLTITDNAIGSPHTVSLTGQGAGSGQAPNVSLSSNSNGLTVSSAGGSATAAILLSPSDGFTGAVNLTCAVQYKGQGASANPPTCSLNPSQIQVSGTAGISTDLTVTKTASSSVKTSFARRTFAEPGLALAGLMILGLWPGRRRHSFLACVLFLALAAGGFAGCGGGSRPSTTSPATVPPTTTSGSYQVVVTATSGNVTASATLPLTVQ